MRIHWVRGLLCAALAVAAAVPSGARGALGGPPSAAAYPYGSEAFTQFLRDSVRETGSTPGEPFYEWFEHAYTTSAARLPGQATLAGALASRARSIRAADDVHRRAQVELDTAVWLYRLIKATVPRFSLSRGYEFVWTVQFGERQCLLQSVLTAGLLQAVGVDAGVAMVWKNMGGQESNNGHAVTVVRLADGRDVEIDASEPRPIATHQGVFAADGRRGIYRFMEPVFDRSGTITAYRPADGRGRELRPRDVRLLGVAFVRSQFYYYRGEQVTGGLVNGPATQEGLHAAARHLQMAVRLDGRNPLAVYMLGRIYLRSGQTRRAKARLMAAYRLYMQAGHVPEGPRVALAAAGKL